MIDNALFPFSSVFNLTTLLPKHLIKEAKLAAWLQQLSPTELALVSQQASQLARELALTIDTFRQEHPFIGVGICQYAVSSIFDCLTTFPLGNLTTSEEKKGS